MRATSLSAQPGDAFALRRRFGGEVYDSGRRWLGPGPGHSSRDRSLSALFKPDGAVLVHSFAGDDWRECSEHLGLGSCIGPRRSRADLVREAEALRRARAAEDARKLAHCHEVWEAAEPAAGSPAETYLRGRGISAALPPSLRFHRAAPTTYGGPGRGPAMVAKVDDSAGKLIGLHVTFLKADGSTKADFPRPKLMFGAVAGGAVRLYDGPTPELVAAAEGIETGLAYSLLKGVPTLACLSAIGLERLQLPAGVGRLVVAADGDEAGQRAARHLINRARRACATALDAAPSGKDWNDVLRESAA